MRDLFYSITQQIQKRGIKVRKLYVVKENFEIRLVKEKSSP